MVDMTPPPPLSTDKKKKKTQKKIQAELKFKSQSK